MTSKMRQAMLNIRALNAAQLTAIIDHVDEAAAATRQQMKTMGSRYKLKVGIPLLRDYATFRKKLVTELEIKTK